jgi:(p)ppGpp synthase/HD superfamily hydrolase
MNKETRELEAKVLSKAISIASRLYEDKLDKGGSPYILHCIRVMNSFDSNCSLNKAAAVLHDVVEDGYITQSELEVLGMPQDVLYLVDLLTHKKGETYEEYIREIS